MRLGFGEVFYHNLCVLFFVDIIEDMVHKMLSENLFVEWIAIHFCVSMKGGGS